jgi:hypothetical protein
VSRLTDDPSSMRAHHGLGGRSAEFRGDQSRVAPAAGAIAALIAAAIGGSVWVLLVEFDFRWTILTISAVLALLPIIVSVARNRFDVLEPVTLMAVTYLVIYVGRPAYDLASGNFSYAGIDTQGTYDQMLVTALVGWMAAMIGYYSPLGRRLGSRMRRPADEWRGGVIFFLCGGLLVLMLAAWMVFVATNGGPSILQGRTQGLANSFDRVGAYLVDSIVIFTPVALVAFALAGSMSRARFALGLTCLVAVVVLSLGTGDRHFIISFALSLGTLYYLRRGRRPTPVTLVAVLFIGLVAMLSIGATRYQTTGANTIQIAQAALTDPVGDLNAALTGEDTGMAPALATELIVVPGTTGYWYGRASLLDLIERPIPRLLWPDKPISGRLTVLQGLWGPSACQYGAQCSTFGAYGDLYLDGGLIGVALGFVVLGIFFRAAYSYLRSDPGNSFVQISYAIVFPYAALYFLQIFVDLTSALIFMLPVLLLVIWLARRKSVSLGRAATRLASATFPSIS